MPTIGEMIQDLLNRPSMPNSFSTYMGKRIREAREEMSFSQEELARQIYKRRASISEMENGKMYPDAVDLALMAAVLKKPLSFFVIPNLPIPHDDEVTGDEAELLSEFRRIKEDKNRKVAIEQVCIVADDEADPGHIFRYSGQG